MHKLWLLLTGRAYIHNPCAACEKREATLTITVRIEQDGGSRTRQFANEKVRVCDTCMSAALGHAAWNALSSYDLSDPAWFSSEVSRLHVSDFRQSVANI